MNANHVANAISGKKIRPVRCLLKRDNVWDVGARTRGFSNQNGVRALLGVHLPPLIELAVLYHKFSLNLLGR